MLRLKQDKRRRRRRNGRSVPSLSSASGKDRRSLRRIHAAGLFLRRPYKILICCVVNVLVILFSAVEGVQVTEMRSAMDEALQSRFYTGTVTKYAGDITYYDPYTPIGKDAFDILSSSPYVDSVYTCVQRTARFGNKLKYVQGQAADYSMFVGVAGSDLAEVNSYDILRQQFQIRPTFLAAGDPDGLSLKYSENAIFPQVVFSHYDEALEVHRGQRVFLFAAATHAPRQNAKIIYVYNPPEDIEMYYPRFSFIEIAGPEDEELTDEEFAAKVIAAHGLEEVARRLDDIQDMTTVLEIPTLEMFLPYRNDLMRVVSGRAITEEDMGKKICMISSGMIASLRKAVGEKISLSVSVHDLSHGGNGLPGIFNEYDADDFQPMEEYEIVGVYSNDSGRGLDSDTERFFLKEILIPKQTADASYEPANMYRFSYSVHKDDYEHYVFNTEAKLREAGYSVVMSRPEYADVETQLEDLRSRSLTTFITSGLALAVGVAIAAGSLILFWRSEYLTERRLGARRREAGGIYVRVYFMVAAVSLLASSAAALFMAKERKFPVLSMEMLSRHWKLMAALAAAELIACAVTAFFILLSTDRRKMGGGR